MKPSALEIIAATFAVVIAPPLSRGEEIALFAESDLGRDADALRDLSPADLAEIRAELREDILRAGGKDISASANRHLPRKVPQ